MKHYIAIMVLLLGTTTSHGFAEMGHGMMRDSGMMGQSGHMMRSGQSMDRGNIMGELKGLTRDVSDLMRQMSELMESDISKERAHAVSSLVRDMAAEMNRMSFMMDSGVTTEEEMRDIQERMMEIRKQVRSINNQ